MQTCHLVVMGVSGCGKSTLGTELAQSLQRKFIEGDDYHTSQSIEKMKAGQPLTDQDRIPWLNQLAQLLSDAMIPPYSPALLSSMHTGKFSDRAQRPFSLSISNLIWILHQID